MSICKLGEQTPSGGLDGKSYLEWSDADLMNVASLGVKSDISRVVLLEEFLEIY
jgi:hypothetical protein